MDEWRFGSFELRPDSRELFKGRAPVEIGGRAFDLLVALVVRRDRVVPRTELVELVWPERVVEENNLAVQVLALRRILGDRAIATVPGRGYRFALRVDGDADLTAAPPGKPREDASALPPLALTTLYGRGNDLDTLCRLLDAHRLVTVVGAGGIGKSSLAAEAVRRCKLTQPDRIVWVELGPIADAALLPSQVGRAFGVQTGGSFDMQRALATALAHINALLVLDNAEHLVDAAAPLVHALLVGAPCLRLLVTSQAPLKVEGEHVLRLATLSVPPEGASAAEALTHGAVALFVEQVRATDPRFAFDDARAGAVIDLCRRLDGLPLAIKLAAPRVPLLGLREMGKRLEQSLRLLNGGQRSSPTRQQTLRATLDWSHGLLATDEQAVFRRLGVFAGGFTLALAQTVAIDDDVDAATVVECVASLVERSLVAADAADPPRYHLLASARQYALLKLEEAGERAATQQRHALVLAEHFERAALALDRQSTGDWLADHQPEIDNLRAAVEWATVHEPALAIGMVGASRQLFEALNLRHEFRLRCAALEPAARAAAPSPTLMRYWFERGLSLIGRNHVELQLHASHAEALCRRLGDRTDLYRVLCLRVFGMVAGAPNSYSALLAEAVALEGDDWPPHLLAWGQIARCAHQVVLGEFDSAFAIADAGHRAAAAAGAEWYAGVLLDFRAMANLYRGRAEEALRDTTTLLELSRNYSVGLDALSMGLHVQALLGVRRIDEARRVLRMLYAKLRVADWDSFDYYCDAYIRLAQREGRNADVVRLIGYAELVAPRIGMQWPRTQASRRKVLTSVEMESGAAACAEWLAEGRRLDPAGVCSTTLRSG